MFQYIFIFTRYIPTYIFEFYLNFVRLGLQCLHTYINDKIQLGYVKTSIITSISYAVLTLISDSLYYYFHLVKVVHVAHCIVVDSALTEQTETTIHRIAVSFRRSSFRLPNKTLRPCTELWCIIVCWAASGHSERSFLKGYTCFINDMEKEIVTKFIEAYKLNVCLWDSTSVDYGNKQKRQAAYEELNSILKSLDNTATVETTKKKIEMLRNSYRREKKKVEKSQKPGRRSTITSSIIIYTYFFYTMTQLFFS